MGRASLETEVVINQLEMLSGRGKKEYAKEAQTIAEAAPDSLRGVRLAAGLSVRELSRRTGIPPSTISAVERGRILSWPRSAHYWPGTTQIRD